MINFYMNYEKLNNISVIIMINITNRIKLKSYVANITYFFICQK
jgi:hypothetical protein